MTSMRKMDALLRVAEAAEVVARKRHDEAALDRLDDALLELERVEEAELHPDLAGRCRTCGKPMHPAVAELADCRDCE